MSVFLGLPYLGAFRSRLIESISSTSGVEALSNYITALGYETDSEQVPNLLARRCSHDGKRHHPFSRLALARNANGCELATS